MIIVTTAPMRKSSWRVTKKKPYDVVALIAHFDRDAAQIVAKPISDSALTASINTQSMLRDGSLGLDRMLPSPLSGRRRKKDSATDQSFRPDVPPRQYALVS